MHNFAAMNCIVNFIINIGLPIMVFAVATSTCAACWTLEYPKSSQELAFVEDAFQSAPNGANTTTIMKHLRREEIKLAQGDSKDGIHLAKLLRKYIDIGATGQGYRCSLEWASDLAFLVEYHSTIDDSSRSLEFLRNSTIDQFELCYPKWGENFSKSIDAIPERIRQKMEDLLDNLVTINEKKSKIMPKRPYERQVLRNAIKVIPSAGMLLFMVRKGYIVDVDENMKNYRFSREKFKQIYEKSIATMSLCKRICNELEYSSAVFDYLLNRNLDSPKAKVFTSKIDPRQIEWLANRNICCKIYRSFERKDRVDPIMEKVYLQLTSDSEVQEMTDDEQSILYQYFKD